MEPLDLAIDKPFEDSREFLIFTHALKSRVMMLTLFSSYFIVFVFFCEYLVSKVRQWDALPAVLLSAQEIPQWVLLLLVASAWIIALVVLVYLGWALVDFWGLQVWINPAKLVIKNTITGGFLTGMMGVGMVDLKDVTEIRGRWFWTRVVEGDTRLRFSPVDRLDLLIAKLMEYAENAEFS